MVLGEIQASYANYVHSVNDHNNYHQLNYYPQKIQSAERQLANYSDYHQNLKKQYAIIEEQYRISTQKFTRDSLLYTGEAISKAEYEAAKSSLLQQSLALENAGTSVDNVIIQINSIKDNILDLKLQQSERIFTLSQALTAAEEQLMNAISSWEVNYCLRSPIAGRVTFVKYWTAHQFVSAGSQVFSVIPEDEKELLGVAMLPMARSGKVKVGQRVIIRFTNYPDQEFGVVQGQVMAISLVPAESQYRVEITLPNGLLTNYKVELPFSHELQGNAEIVTKDLRLIERFIMPVKKILKNNQ
jgi:Multidrug resistance efflux pump